MNKKALAVFGGAIVVAIAIIVIISSVYGSSTPPSLKNMKVLASSFPAPSTAQAGPPDSQIKNPPTYTRQWIAQGDLNNECGSWREAYRNWIGNENLGQVTGDNIAGQSCSFIGPKNGFQATLQVAVYGTNPQPQITLTITKP